MLFGHKQFRFIHKGEKKVTASGGLCRMWGMIPMAAFFWTFSEGRRISLSGRFTENAQEGPACRVRGRLGKLIDLAVGRVISRDFSRGMPSELADSALCAWCLGPLGESTLHRFFSVLSVSFDSLARARLAPSGPTFGCSTSRLPRRSVVVNHPRISPP
jgi:hypothetical protein